MPTKNKLHLRSSRRTFIKSIGAAGSLAVASPFIARAQGKTEIKVFTLQSLPIQMKAYEGMVARFEAANPDIKVNLLPISQKDLWPLLAASYAGGDVPDLVLQMTAENVVSMYGQGLLAPMDDVINEVGKDDFEPSAIALYNDGTHYFAVPAANNSLSILWYRKDLLGEAGLEVPTTWSQYVKMAQVLTRNGMYGASMPFGQAAMANSITWTLVYQAGGHIIGPDMSVVFNSDATVQMLEFLKEIHAYVPRGSNRYDFLDVLKAYVTGTAASCMYTGRAIANVNTENPGIADNISCAPFPIADNGRPWWSGTFEALVLPKAAKNPEAAKRFAAWNFDREGYISFLHATPGHQFPTLRSVRDSQEFRSHPLLVKYDKELSIMADTLTKAFATCKPSNDFPLILRAGELQSSGIFADTIQRVVIQGESAKAAAAWGQDRIAEFMKS